LPRKIDWLLTISIVNQIPQLAQERIWHRPATTFASGSEEQLYRGPIVIVSDELLNRGVSEPLLGLGFHRKTPSAVTPSSNSSFVRGIEIVRRDEDLKVKPFGSLEDQLHVLNGIVLLKAFADERPREAFFAQDVVLRINENNRSISCVNLHSNFLFKFSDGCDRFKLAPPANRRGLAR
jgi:hypothetical protein